ncbi:hypothetical protein [Siccirubricoccus phaeus]|uniref:hypothetical protein n=1 Tax=Siccirubricoccus phaeus TaxID=2595053 RepID=UPI0011F21946|nr:hypothetical protein [Siccirubricoccus phaeus]
MQFFRLLRVAAQAEGLRWRRMGRGYAIQAALGLAAAAFALMLLVMLHVAALIWLAEGRSGIAAALILAVFDLVVLAVLGWLAARGVEDPVALGAARVRDDALQQIGDQATRAALLAPLLKSQSAKKGLIGAAVTAAVVGLLTRR